MAIEVCVGNLPPHCVCDAVVLKGGELSNSPIVLKIIPAGPLARGSVEDEDVYAFRVLL